MKKIIIITALLSASAFAVFSMMPGTYPCEFNNSEHICNINPEVPFFPGCPANYTLNTVCASDCEITYLSKVLSLQEEACDDLRQACATREEMIESCDTELADCLASPENDPADCAQAHIDCYNTVLEENNQVISSIVRNYEAALDKAQNEFYHCMVDCCEPN